MLQRTLLVGATLAAASLNAQTGPAANNPAEDVYELPELVVTGLWEWNSTTSASVSVIDSERFNASGAQHMEDILGDPQPHLDRGTSRLRHIQIRASVKLPIEGETRFLRAFSGRRHGLHRPRHHRQPLRHPTGRYSRPKPVFGVNAAEA